MRDYVEVFKQVGKNSEIECIEGALECLDRFGSAFEREDIVGMDSCCHFPHYLVSGNEMICWENKGQLTEAFFDDLKEKGFKRTVVTKREPVLVCENKVHFYYCYYREDVCGNVMSRHENLWIVTYKDGKWGIQLRSY